MNRRNLLIGALSTVVAMFASPLRLLGKLKRVDSDLQHLPFRFATQVMELRKAGKKTGFLWCVLYIEHNGEVVKWIIRTDWYEGWRMPPSWSESSKYRFDLSYESMLPDIILNEYYTYLPKEFQEQIYKLRVKGKTSGKLMYCVATTYDKEREADIEYRFIDWQEGCGVKLPHGLIFGPPLKINSNDSTKCASSLISCVYNKG